MASLTTKDEFVNTTDGWLGAVQLDHMGRSIGVSIEPSGSVFLTEDEQMLTANAPKADTDNPFTNGALAIRTRAVEMKNRRPYGAPTETGAAPAPLDAPPVGSAAAGEEVATPNARRRKP